VQVLVLLDCSSMIAVLPERSLPVLALVVFLSDAAGDELHALGNYVWARVFDQKMNVVDRDRIIEHAQTKAFLSLEHPMQVTASVARSEASRKYKFRVSLILLNDWN
jgi:hypothetical protein